MSGIYLPRLFPPHIAERGLLYFQQGKLDSDLYIKDGGCDCPYGGACKHMAVLWYAVRAQTQGNQSAESDAQQPKKGGNPYRQRFPRIFPALIIIESMLSA